MKFSEYRKRLYEYEFDSTLIISYKNKCHVYNGEPDFNDMFVVCDNFIYLNEYMTHDGIQVSLSDEPKDSEILALEILQSHHKREIERKRKARQELKEYQEWCRKQEMLDNLCLGMIFITLIISGGGIWLASKIGWL